MDVNALLSTTIRANACQSLNRSASTGEPAVQVAEQLMSAGNSPVNCATGGLAGGVNVLPSGVAKCLPECLCSCHAHSPATPTTSPQIVVPLIPVNPPLGGETLIPTTPPLGGETVLPTTPPLGGETVLPTTPPHIDLPSIPTIPVGATPTDVPPINVNPQLPGIVADEPDLPQVNGKLVPPDIEIGPGEHDAQGKAVINGKPAESLADMASEQDHYNRAESGNLVSGGKEDNGLPDGEVLPDLVAALNITE